MLGLGPVFTVLFVIAISLVMVRFATVSLTLTGVSKDLAQFQALSAFTGSGFTTKESEEIVNHPLRRRIVMHLMLLGNVGIVIAISSLLLSFLSTTNRDDLWYDDLWVKLVVLSLGVVFLLILASSHYVEQLMWRVNTWALRRWVHIEVHDYTKLLRLAHNYIVCELAVREDEWLTGRTLAELQLASEGVLVLGIERRDGTYLGAPRGLTKVEAGDSLILYGQQETLIDLESRAADMIGNLHHVIAVTRQLDLLEDEVQQDKKFRADNPDEQG
jgi:hypothetical protein